MYTLGIDIGSTTSKCVLLEDGVRITADALVQAGTGTDGPRRAVNELLLKAGISREEISRTVATGYGRKRCEGADVQVSELTCHALGSHFLFPEARTVIDIGGQDAKVLTLNEKGRLVSFQMNDKCAAGTGRFLDVMAHILQLDISQLEEEYKKADAPAAISSTCTVFAESEVISQLSNGVSIPNVTAGICDSVAARVSALAKREGIKGAVCMSGGVARNGGVRDALGKALGVEILYSPYAQLTGALGAALYGCK